MTLVVRDDGIGPPVDADGAGRGLVNMAARAEQLGGELSLGPCPEGGAVLVWRAPGGRVTGRP